MKKKSLVILSLVGSMLLFTASCDKKPSSAQQQSDVASNDSTMRDSTAQDSMIDENADTVSKKEPLRDLKGDEEINRATRFYAGISKEGIHMSSADSQSWDQYSKDIKRFIQMSKKAHDGVESIASNDFSDFRDKVDYVFYPFSGADFVYPITLYPDADTYFLCGLEQTGTPIGSNVKTSYSHYEAYRKALITFFRSSFFITKDMKGDLNNSEIKGVCPVITMLMAVEGYDIISIKYKSLDESGNLADSDSKSNILEYKFFRPGSKHEQTLYYFCCNVSNSGMKANPNLCAYLDNTLPKHTVGSYLKAASFLLHGEDFSTIRNYLLDNSLAIVQDDSGIPYRKLIEKYDITLYGKYKDPPLCFERKDCQRDLEQKYKDDAANVRPLPFRIGYNNPSNWMCARRKGAGA